MGIMVKFAGDEFSVAELSAAVLDGHLVGVGEGYAPTDAPETPWLRLHALRPLLGTGLAATHAVAAWVWGALAEAPGVITAQRATASRGYVMPDRRIVYRDGFVGSDDIAWFGDVATTTVTRTVADLARMRDMCTLELMLGLYPASAPSAISWCIANPRRPGARAGVTALESYVAGHPPYDVSTSAMTV